MSKARVMVATAILKNPHTLSLVLSGNVQRVILAEHASRYADVLIDLLENEKASMEEMELTVAQYSELVHHCISRWNDQMQGHAKVCAANCLANARQLLEGIAKEPRAAKAEKPKKPEPVDDDPAKAAAGTAKEATGNVETPETPEVDATVESGDATVEVDAEADVEAGEPSNVNPETGEPDALIDDLSLGEKTKKALKDHGMTWASDIMPYNEKKSISETVDGVGPQIWQKITEEVARVTKK